MTFDKNIFFKQKGFTLVELLIAISLAALFLPSIIYTLSFSLNSAVQGENYTKAYSMAQDKMEIIYYLKENDPNWDWTSYPEANTETDFYQPVKIDGNWELGPKTSFPVESEGYTATVKILSVSRDAGEISENPWSIYDPTSRKIVVNVSWRENGSPTYIDLVSYVSKH